MEAYATVELVFQTSTEDALCFHDEDGKNIWIPFSQLHDDAREISANRGDVVSVEVKERWATKHGLT